MRPAHPARFLTTRVSSVAYKTVKSPHEERLAH
jgi:hypothetical protein